MSDKKLTSQCPNDHIINNFRTMTRLALPEDDAYIVKLGIALYVFASINSFVTEILCLLDSSLDRVRLLESTSGRIAKLLEKQQSNNKDLSLSRYLNDVTAWFGNYKDLRNDIMHSYPITNDRGEQILHRRYGKDKYFEIDGVFLDSFISEAEKISDALYSIRSVLEVSK